jgi:NAD(P)H-hydrate repair Nnr-like enzyme with NAD(P)H-hydrate dehydratase domain
VTHSQVIMTPHDGEMRRLIPDAFDQTTCRVSLAQIVARRFECIILFKGAKTIIARPDGACVMINSTAFESAAWLATAGSGDVLSGFITGLMARGFGAFEAAALGAHLHVLCADDIGPGLIAEDIPNALPGVIRKIISNAPFDLEQSPMS